ncbi:hypothetical protein KP509_05G061300 [Ceratopteris richardii]|uniref:Kinesin motor domain-containing protein n=2 Tax=Ceratopteris richardii TaxID=49495 RepID=A0A8T2UUY5_CERRI|nr:hypothetical protein KP509_05G061300 [Ceratopteris richardii]
MASRHEKDKGVNVQVLLRCRPFNNDELRSNVPQAVTCRDLQHEVAVTQHIAGKQTDRIFVFDKVFGPQSQQKDLYDQAIVPIVNEVLEGFNCTIFAYGQTGTGKTYTMEGAGRNSRNGELPPEAGVIPRAIKQIFDTLELQHADYSVKVTFLELYNEETTDLLAADEISKVVDEKKKSLSLMEDGKGGVIVRGLAEVIVTNSSEIFNLLDRGSSKRRTAETLLNKQSSRSHSIFSITIHIKENTPEGEELIKCGKLNLVDLAGSENICRSGAKEGRAREAGEINKSLLTLGRVITSLVEHLGHVPYRDSKLTRLLRDSLGGRTKTCIIATISPSIHCLEETLSTLDYAQRAKNIRNKPEVNQKLTKTTLIKELYGEIDKLKTDLHAARERCGIYIPQERYYQDEANKKTMAEKLERVEEDLACTKKLLEEMRAKYELEHDNCKEICAQLDLKQKDLERTKECLIIAKENIRQANAKIVERDFLIASQQQSEALLLEKSNHMRSNFEQTVQDVNDKKNQVEASNLKALQSFQSDLFRCLDTFQNDLRSSIKQQQEEIFSLDEQIQEFMRLKLHFSEEMRTKVQDLKLLYFARLQDLLELVEAHEGDSSLALNKLIRIGSRHAANIQDVVRDAVLEAELVMQDLQCTLSKQQNEMAAFAHKQRERAHTSLVGIKEICKSTFDAFQRIGKYTAELHNHIDDCTVIQERSLIEFEKLFEEQARFEEQQMLQDIAVVLAKTKAQKTAFIHEVLSSMREMSASEKSIIYDGVDKVTNLTCTTQKRWETFLHQTEATSINEFGELAARHCELETLLQKCMQERDEALKQWRKVEHLVEQCNKLHLPVTELIIREASEAGQRLQEKVRQAVLASEVELEVHNGSLVQQTLDTSVLDKRAENGFQCSMSGQLQHLTTLKSLHSAKVEELHNISIQCFGNFKEDQSTNATPKRRTIRVPSIEEICTVSSRDLTEKCKESTNRTSKENEGVELQNTPRQSHRTVAPPTRIPLARIN